MLKHLQDIIMCVFCGFTFTLRFGAVPGAVLGADQSRGPVGVHGETGRALETDRAVVGEVVAQPHPVGRHPGVATVDHCEKQNRMNT